MGNNRKSDMLNMSESPFLMILPMAANHFMIKSRGGNVMDITTSMSSDDEIYLLTKNGTRIVISENGNVSCIE